MSVDSEYQSDSSFGFDTPRPSTDKRAKYSNNKWDNFTFPSPPGLQNNKDIPDSIRKQVIRDVYTCMRAQCQGEKISSQDFVMVAKKVCRKIPQLKDQEPVGLKLRADFAYYVSSYTLNPLVCLQSCHFFNRVEGKGKGGKKGALKFSCCCTVCELWAGLFMSMMQFLSGKYNTTKFIGPVIQQP